MLKGNQVGVDPVHGMIGDEKPCKLKGEILLQDRTGTKVREDICSHQIPMNSQKSPSDGGESHEMYIRNSA